MSNLLELAERCEAASGPDRVLDAEIGAFFQRQKVIEAGYDGNDIVIDANNPGRVSDCVGFWASPTFTASLDAAMTLVPEGWGWLISQPNAKALASGLLKKRTPVMGEVQNGCDHRYAVACATPALALTAAALRARHASQEQSQ